MGRSENPRWAAGWGLPGLAAGLAGRTSTDRGGAALRLWAGATAVWVPLG